MSLNFSLHSFPNSSLVFEVALQLAIVEPVFGNIKAQKRLNRFTLRTKEKVNIQWGLYCTIHNIEKIANYGAM